MSVPAVHLTPIGFQRCADCKKCEHPRRQPFKSAITMNRFRSRKKALDGGETDVPPVPSYSRTFKRSKKPAPEPKQPAVDLATALPPSADFRTSLLMPNLSARFSMLREQDDPTSKIGKANDDSVLFPKRASRLNLFHRNELTDIAEVASLNGSIRPRFASQADSYGSSDGYGTDDGYLMSRPRPGEGNNLFGGRQKIYRIPVGARSSSGDGNGNGDGHVAARTGMSGRALYGDDVASSAFPRLAPQENHDRTEVSSEPSSVRSSEVPIRSDSPPFPYDQKRETTSSTTSMQVESRISTAATSVASQRSVNGVPVGSVGSPPPIRGAAPVATNPPSGDRQAAKSRRLYGQGLDQHLHDQQSSAMHRLESLQRQRAIGAPSLPRKLSQPRSGSNLQDRYQRSGASNISGSYRAASPPASGSPSRLREFDLGLAEEGPVTATSQSETGYFRSPPLSPPMSPVPDPKLVAALEPNDVGKATALGAFNKPSQQYDEQQYLERQIQLQQRRETPPIPHPSSPPALCIDQPTTDQPRGDSPVSPLSRSNSVETGQPSDPGRRIVSEIYHGDTKEHETTDQTPTELRETFLAAETPTDIGSPLSESGSGILSNRQASSTHPSPAKWIFENPRPEKPRDVDHPIHRQPYRTYFPNSPEEKVVDHSRRTTASHPSGSAPVDPAKGKGPNTDSPTLGPAKEVTGLNGLVNTHLRNDSGQSSIYPEPSPPLDSNFPDDFRRENLPFSHDPEGRSSETFFRKSTWEDVGLHGKPSAVGEARQAPVAVPPPLSLRARQVLEQAVALQHHNSPKVQQMLGLESSAERIVGRGAPRGNQEATAASVPTWQEQLKAHHTRGGSTETKKERQSFANELAERRRMVQDNLKSFVENESRSNSPMPGHRTQEHSPSKPGTAFGMLRSKTSRGTMAARQEHSSKAMKMLGISVGPSPPNGSLPPRQGSLLEHADGQVASPSAHDPRAPTHPRPGPPDSRQHQNPIYAPRRAEPPNDRRQESLPGRSPPLSKPSRDDRSNSDSSERGFDGRTSRSTTSGPQDREANLGYYPSGAQARAYSNFSRLPSDPGNATATPSSAERSRSAMSGRIRSDSKANAPGGNVEHRGNLSHYPSPADTSPGSAHSGHSTPSHEQASLNVPVMTTPFMMAPPHATATARLPSHRKRSINKHDISDPTFVSSTSSMSTVDLPPGASLSNGMSPAAYAEPSPGVPPPIPPINPRRRRTQTLRQALGRLEKPDAASRPSRSSQPDPYEERSTFSADEGESKAPSRSRLRKISSEGGNMNVKARQQILLAPSPAIPPYPQSYSADASPAMRGFPHPVPANGPATGVMF